MTPPRLRYVQLDHWPPLAWLARCGRGDTCIEVYHGPKVETTAEWFAEATWAGPYERGDFDRTDLVFGSGGRVRGGDVVFVPAGSTVDRLQSLERPDAVLVSNSLPCLLAVADARVDPVYPHFFRDFGAITRGLGRKDRPLLSSAGPVTLQYYHNLRWTGRALRREPKPLTVRDFSAFARYRAFLDRTLELLTANLQAPDRRFPYRLLGTLSSGYDSPTIAALARPHGLREVLSFRAPQDSAPDAGEEIGPVLGVSAWTVSRDAWRERLFPEVSFLSSDAKGEDVYFAGAEGQLAGAVLLTGFHGDKMWDRDTRALGPDIVRGDQSGLSLTEFRLRAGFIHCPLAFAGVRQIRDVNAISRSPELKPWDVPGDYSRPICRRIVEGAGVPRSYFGVEKRASSVLFFRQESFLSPRSLIDYNEWLEAHASLWRGRGRTPPSGGGGAAWRPALRAAASLAHAVAVIAPHIVADLPRAAARRLALWSGHQPLFPFVFPWALERAKAAYHQGVARKAA